MLRKWLIQGYRTADFKIVIFGQSIG
ncbi:conserved protein of unknown function [Pseudomonas marincola]|uniref:Uncharacterized protein n=1 Tax=Pseudomonas marincola TaxID=437900 RepID=A0A653E991_9PSED|nr:conserved protein of unknown function [Pseudomonas marincola]